MTHPRKLRRMDRTIEGFRLVSRLQARFMRAAETVALEVRSEASDPSWSGKRTGRGRWAQGQRTYHRHYSPKARAKKKRRRSMTRASRRANRR